MNWNYEKQIGKNIRIMREKNNMTQDFLAAQMQLQGCDITRSALAKIEVGQRHIYVDELVLFKKLLGVSFEELTEV
ncbi:MAG: helix-turn-helix domain-containing protein [Acutalibacteraceae bacterium]